MKRFAAMFLVAVHAAGAFFELDQSALTHSSNLFSITPPVINTEMATTNMDEQSFINALIVRKEVVTKLYHNQVRLLNNQFYAAVNRPNAAYTANDCMQADLKLSYDLQWAEENVEHTLNAHVASEATAYRIVVDEKVSHLLSVNQPERVGKFIADLWGYEVCRYALSAIESYVYYSEYAKYTAHFAQIRNSAFFEAVHGGAPRTPKNLQLLVTPAFNAMRLSEKLYDHMQCANRLLSASIEHTSVLQTLSAGLVGDGKLSADVTFNLDCINQDAYNTTIPQAAKLILLDHFARAINDIDSGYFKNAKNRVDNTESATKILAVRKGADAVLLALENIYKLLNATNMTVLSNNVVLENLNAVQCKIEALHQSSAMAMKQENTINDYSNVEHQEHLLLRRCILDIHTSTEAASSVSELMDLIYTVHAKFIQRTAGITTGNIMAREAKLNYNVAHAQKTLNHCYGVFKKTMNAFNLLPPQSQDGADTSEANLLNIWRDKATVSINNLRNRVNLFRDAVVSLTSHQAYQPIAMAQVKAFDRFESPHALLTTLQEHGYW